MDVNGRVESGTETEQLPNTFPTLLKADVFLSYIGMIMPTHATSNIAI